MPENDEDVKQLLVRLPRKLHREAKTRAAMTGRPMQEIVKELLEEWLEEERKKEQGGNK